MRVAAIELFVWLHLRAEMVPHARKSNDALAAFLGQKDPLIFPLLRWLMASNRSHLRKCVLLHAVCFEPTSINQVEGLGADAAGHRVQGAVCSAAAIARARDLVAHPEGSHSP